MAMIRRGTSDAENANNKKGSYTYSTVLYCKAATVKFTTTSSSSFHPTTYS